MIKASSKHKLHITFLVIILVVFNIVILLFNRPPKFVLVLHPEDPGSAREKYIKTQGLTYSPDATWDLLKTSSIDTQPDFQAHSAILADIGNGKVYVEKNSSKRAKIASLTKIMTAVVVLEHAPLSKELTVSERAATVGENAMGISTGEIYTVEELMYGLILNSGNDAAYALAEGVAGDVETFTKWMNIKASDLGLINTYFAEPSGLDDSTYSSPEDLLRLTRYALKNPEFRRLVKTLNYELPFSDKHKYLYLENQTNLLRSYPGIAGVKTGFTEEAGLCLVTYANNFNHEFVGVVLGSTDRKGDMILMLDHANAGIGQKIEHHLLDPI